MSTETNPADDEYLQLEKRLGSQEQELAASLAEADRTLDGAAERSLQRFKTPIDQLDAKAAAKRGAAREQAEAATSDAVAAGRRFSTGSPRSMRHPARGGASARRRSTRRA